ncbi:MAG: helicase-related protein [Halothece sp. Uz-M2-17]|nr:helicase-related protein [Halothece sp. Uz-M2-17]
MSHDIVDNRQEKLVDQINRILSTSESAHFAVGYFFLSGFTAIARNLNHIKQLRLLIGNTTNQETLDQLAEGYKRLELVQDTLEEQNYIKRSFRQHIATETAENIRSTVELMDQTNEGETLVKNLIQMIEEGRLDVRIYTKGRLHAKAYIFDYGKVYDQNGNPLERNENGIAIAGSSNLSLSGISNNTELNVIVHGNNNHSALTHWFNELWEEAEEFNANLMAEMQQSWAIAPTSPYDIYLKTLYMLVRDRLEEENPVTLLSDDEISQQLADFQKVAVQQAVKTIQEYGGCFISDVVGLGKSFIGTAIIKRFEQMQRARPLIICPRPLMEMWERYNEVYHLNARVLSMGQLTESEDDGARWLLEDFRYRDRDFVLIDESHNLRNLGTQRYRVVETFLASGKQCCLLTATPRNKTAWDIYNQIKLFHQDDQTDLPVDPPNLKQYFQQVEKGDRQLQNLLSHILIRRTRNHILRWYGYDAETHTRVDSQNFQPYLQGKRRAYIHVGGKHRFFPKRELETIEYSIEETYQGLYQEIRGYLGKSRKRQRKTPVKDELCYARYGLGNYVVKSKQKQDPYLSLQSAGTNLRGLMRVLLFKRFESSVYAFQQTIKRLLKTYEYFDLALNEGFVPAGEEAQTILHGEANAGEETDILQQLKQVSDKYRIEDFQRDRLHEHIQHDLMLLGKIEALVQPITPEKDTKLQTLKQKLNQSPFQTGKCLIFTQYADTAQYLYDHLNGTGKEVEVIYSNDKNKARIVGRFAPNANPEQKLNSGEKEIQTLIATDVLAEGLNLQDGNIIINYDLHWNPVKLIQRFGRIDRIGSENDVIYGYNFLPETGLEKNLKLREKLQHRIQEIHDTIGEDAAILDREEQLNEEAMYAIYEQESTQLSLFESTDESLDLNEAEEILRQLQQEDPEEYERITRLPHGLRSSQFSTKKGTYVFCEATYPNRPELKGYQQLFLLDEQGEIISRDVPYILGQIYTNPNTKPLSLPKHYNAILMKIKRQFEQELQHRNAEKDHRRQLTQGQRYISKELRAYYQTVSDPDLQRSIDILEQTFRQPMTNVLRRELNQIRREGLTDVALVTRLKQLYHQHNIGEWRDKKLAREEKPIATIICSEALV